MSLRWTLLVTEWQNCSCLQNKRPSKVTSSLSEVQCILTGSSSFWFQTPVHCLCSITALILIRAGNATQPAEKLQNKKSINTESCFKNNYLSRSYLLNVVLRTTMVKLLALLPTKRKENDPSGSYQWFELLFVLTQCLSHSHCRSELHCGRLCKEHRRKVNPSSKVYKPSAWLYCFISLSTMQEEKGADSHAVLYTVQRNKYTIRVAKTQFKCSLRCCM